MRANTTEEDKMNTQTAIDVVDAMRTLSEYTGIEFGQLGARIVFYDDEVKDKLIEAFTEYNSFVEVPIEERGRRLGLTITVEDAPACAGDLEEDV